MKSPRKPRPRGQSIKRPEQTLQIEVADFLRATTIPPARWWFVPNGANLSVVQRAKFQQMGLTSGVHDLHFAWSTPNYGPMFGTIELKAGKGKLSDNQKQFWDDMWANGHKCGMATNLKEVVDLLNAWNFPLKKAVI